MLRLAVPDLVVDPLRRPEQPLAALDRLARTLLEETGLLLRASRHQVERLLAPSLLEETRLLLRAPNPQVGRQRLAELVAAQLEAPEMLAAHPVSLPAAFLAALVRQAPAR